MADVDSTLPQPQPEPEMTEEQRLKYLEFVHVAAARALVLAAAFYIYAKENSGPLKPGVETVEGAVKNVVGPVYSKFQDVPIGILKFADQKVEGLVDEVKRHVPPKVKEASTQAVSAAQKVPEVARSISSEVQRAGVVGTATGVAKNAYSKVEPAAKDLYVKYEPVAEQYAVKAWKSLNRLPLVPEVAHVVVPTAAHLSEKYNKAVASAAERGYAVSNYLPFVPTEKIAKLFGEDGKGAESVEITGWKETLE